MNTQFAALAAAIFAPCLLPAATFIAPAVSVGENLAMESRVGLSEAAPKGGLKVKVASTDPTKILFALHGDQAGTESITVPIAEGQRSSPEFVVYGLANSGSIKYTVTAEGIEPGSGQVALTPSGLLIKGQTQLGTPIRTTRGSWLQKVFVITGQYSADGEFLVAQHLRGGYDAKVTVRSADPSIASAVNSELIIPGGESTAVTDLRTVGVGTTQLIAEGANFTKAGPFHSMNVEVYMPSISILDEMHLGKDLQVNAAVTIGEPAPKGGLDITLESKDPSKMLVSNDVMKMGAAKTVVHIPEGQVSAPYAVQGLVSEGIGEYVASAPGFRPREAALPLVPSGVIIIGPTGLPDEADVLRPNDPSNPNAFATAITSQKPTPVSIYTLRLDPKTLRGADLTLQVLRAGIKMHVKVHNKHPEIGTLEKDHVVIEGGTGLSGVYYHPKKAGTDIVTYETPTGFTRPTNATELTGYITQ